MKEESVGNAHLLSILLIILILLFPLCCFTAHAITRDESVTQAPVVAPLTDASDPSRATSHQWRSFLWEALPAEYLRNTKEGVISEAYQQNDWRPFFVASDFQLTQGARELLDRLARLDREGIDPTGYDLSAIRSGIQKVEQLRLSLKEIDPGFRDAKAAVPNGTAASVREVPTTPSSRNQYAMNSPEVRAQDSMAENGEREKLYLGMYRLSSELDVKLAHDLVSFAHEMNPYSKEQQTKVLLGEISMSEFLKGLEPPSYDELRKMFLKYRQLEQKYPHAERVPDGPSIRKGESGGRIRSLQVRLQQEGYYTGKINGMLDAPTVEALQEFQSAHGLEADGVVGGRTTQWLSMPYKEKAEMVLQSMKLMRQSATRQYERGRYIRVNIPQFVLEYHKNGKIDDVHRIIVGRATGKRIKLRGRVIGENHTPPLASSIEQIVINPRWYVSDRIRRELNDAIASDPSYLSRLGYVKMSSQYPWGEPRIFQQPGPNNPLGQVKFEFPNAYAVFLHDTPKKQLFNRARRDFSHGCIRMEGAQEFAELLLADDQNPSATKTQTYLQSGRQAFIKLQQPVPIIIEYLPVSIDARGRIVFCGDVYNWFGEEPSEKSKRG